MTRAFSAFRATIVVLASLLVATVAAQAEEPETRKDGAVIAAGSKVGLEYTLKLEDGTQVDGNVGGDPLRFEQGSGQIIPGLDKELLGMGVGDTKQVTVAPEDAYGPVYPEAFAEIPVSELPEDARKPGTALMTQDPEGRPQRLTVQKIEGETATLDFNHPLAGKTLIFDVKVLEVR